MSKSTAAQSSVRFRHELKWIIPIAVVCLGVFANSLSGEFVYDDMRQILRNPLIQENSLIWKALTSDVWAFKGGGAIAASNYWRPTFTAWHILNFRLFGANPFGWHVLNVLLHTGVCLLVYGLLRRWAFTPMLACGITLVFAVHPIHVESVAWVSGSPDLLFALAFLGSLWFAQTFAEKEKNKDLVLSLLLYALALGSKEVAILCLPIYYLVFTFKSDGSKKRKPATTSLLSYGAVAAVYFAVRWLILGAFSRPPEGATDAGAALLTIPSMFAFYLRQIVFPYWLSINYPLQSVVHPGLTNLLLPLIVSAGAVVGIIYLTKHVKRGRLAAALFFLPLLPAMNATAFVPDQIVHDRYLYLPLLGMLMLLFSFAGHFLKEQHLLIAAGVVALLLSVQTFTYNRVWTSELSLWSAAVKIDDSSSTAMQYGSALADSDRNDEAILAFTNSINQRPTARSYLGRGRALTKAGRYPEAEKDFLVVLQYPLDKVEAYALYQTYEALGINYLQEHKYDEAVASFRKAKKTLPIYSASLTVDLAIVLYQQGRKDEALRELETVQGQARQELLPEAKAVFLRLGMLYAELGRRDDAREALQEFLRLTGSVSDKTTVANREAARNLLNNLNRQGK